MTGPRQPVFYIPHGGGPCFFMEWNPPGVWDGLEHWLRGFASLTAKPDAILVVSSHWEEPEFTLTAHPHPPLIYDYSGFPPETYTLRYPAPGRPELAQNAAKLLRRAGMKASLDKTRGFDHGVFIPFMLMYPEAEIPIVQLSLKRGLGPADHIAAGKALAPLRDQNILIVGSGMSYHNLRRFGPQAASESMLFDGWLSKTVSDAYWETRNSALVSWESAPAARQAHPREEHLLPLMVAAGAAGEDTGKITFSQPIMGMTISACQFGRAVIT